MATLLQRIEIMFKENTNTQNKTNEGFKNTLDQVDSRLKKLENSFPAKTKQVELAQNRYSVFQDSDDSDNNDGPNQDE